jgi:hypothetical protein
MKLSLKRGFGPSGVIFCAIFTFAAVAGAGTYSGGSGTAEDPYKISTVADWQELIATSADYGKNFILLNDIDFGGANLTPVGKPSTPFTGVFNGNGFSVCNAVVNPPNQYYVGLFGYIGTGGLIQNLAIVNSTIQGDTPVAGLAGSNDGMVTSCYMTGSVIGTNHSSAQLPATGGLVGENSENGTIAYCHATVTVIGTNGSLFPFSAAGGLVGVNNGVIISCTAMGSVTGGSASSAGGLVGYNRGGTITSSHSYCGVDGNVLVGGLVGNNNEGTLNSCSAMGFVNGRSRVGGLVGESAFGTVISCYATGGVKGDICVGGLVGDNYASAITSSYASGTVSGIDDTPTEEGGLAGYNSGMISNCYSRGTIIGTGGGLCGHNDGTIIGSFWDMEFTGKTYSAGGEGKTTAEMKTLSTFTDAGWDFVGEEANGTGDVWRMCGDGVDYPRLSWEFSQGGDMACPDGVSMEDLLYLAGRWMASTPETAGAADGNGDGKVDMEDFAMMAAEWMRM